MPVLEVRLQPGQRVVSQGGEMSWMTPNVSMATSKSGMGTSGLGGVLRRALSGSTIFLSSFEVTSGSGVVAFATKMPGHIKAVRVGSGREYVVSRHGFLAGTDGVTLAVAVQQRLGVGVFSGNGFLLQRIAGEGTAWVELSGELVQYDLAAGESLLVHPGHIGLFDGSVTMAIEQVHGVANVLFGADTLFLVRLTGPGSVYLQTLTVPGLAHALSPYIQPEGK
ncbi:MAG: AIM24 family protein [Acidimicrobiaceae bacterium]|nr:AIM24 family protein [Acidimicrobiaceae bacterium]